MADLKFDATDKGQCATKTKRRTRVLQTSRDSVCAHICDVRTMAAALMMRKYRTDRSGRYVAPKPLDVNILREYMQLTKRAIARRKTQCASGKVKIESRRHCCICTCSCQCFMPSATTKDASSEWNTALSWHSNSLIDARIAIRKDGMWVDMLRALRRLRRYAEQNVDQREASRTLEFILGAVIGPLLQQTYPQDDARAVTAEALKALGKYLGNCCHC